MTTIWTWQCLLIGLCVYEHMQGPASVGFFEINLLVHFQGIFSFRVLIFYKLSLQPKCICHVSAAIALIAEKTLVDCELWKLNYGRRLKHCIAAL